MRIRGSSVCGLTTDVVLGQMKPLSLSATFMEKVAYPGSSAHISHTTPTVLLSLPAKLQPERLIID